MRLSFKVIIWFWVVLLVIISGLFYGAYSKLEPKTFIALLNEQTQLSYPGSTLSVGKVDYKFSVDFNLNLQDITLKRGNKTLGIAEEVELRVPWWLLLFNRGNAQINLSGITVYVEKNEISDASVLSEKNSQSSKNVKLNLPHYLTDAHYTLRVKNLTVKDIETERRYFSVSKFLIREFQYDKNSAFELNIPIEIHHKDTSYNSELWLFGDVTPRVEFWELNYRGEFKTKEATDRFQIDDLVIDGKANFNLAKSDLESNFTLLIEKSSIGSGVAKVKANEFTIQTDFTKLPLSYISLVGEEVKNPYLDKLSGHGEGFLKFVKNFDQDGSSTLNGKLGFEGEFKLDSQAIFPGKWLLAFENSKWETSFLSPKSEVSFFRRAFVDYKNGTVSQYTQELGFTGIDVSNVIHAVEKLSVHKNSSDRPFFSTLVSFKKCLDGEKFIDANFRYGISPEEKYYQANIISEGSFDLNYQQKGQAKFFDLSASKFQWRPYLKFIEEFFTADNALVDGKASGRWSEEWDQGQWLIQVKESSMLGTKGFWHELAQQLVKIFEIDFTTIREMNFNTEIQKNIIKIKNSTFTGTDTAQISGQLSSDMKNKSSLMLSYPKNKKWKPVKKEIKELFWKKGI